MVIFRRNHDQERLGEATLGFQFHGIMNARISLLVDVRTHIRFSPLSFSCIRSNYVLGIHRTTRALYFFILSGTHFYEPIIEHC